MLGHSRHDGLGNPVPWLSPGGGSGAPFRWGLVSGGVVSTTGDLMVVTQYRLLVVSLRVLVDKDTPAADREWSSMMSRIRRARG